MKFKDVINKLYAIPGLQAINHNFLFIGEIQK